ncbi:MAG: hypothetical protein ACR2I9_04855 [Candidatus Nanopelagicaceae bacterium]
MRTRPRLITLLFVLTLVLQIVPATAVTKSIAGTSCARAGLTKSANGLKFTCILSGKKLVWNKGEFTKKTIDPWSIHHKLVVVALTYSGDPGFWDEIPSLQDLDAAGQLGDKLFFDFDVIGKWTWRDYLNDSVDVAMSYWKRSTNNRLIFDAPQIIYAPPGSAKKGENCNLLADAPVAMKYSGLKVLPKGGHIVSINPWRRCGTEGGMAEVRGNQISLIQIYALAHELGHNFGFGHAALLMCQDNNFATLPSSKCYSSEYGDQDDVMGSGFMTEGCSISATNGTTLFGVPDAKDVVLGQVLTLNPNTSFKDVTVYRLKIDKIWYFFEYRSIIEGKDANGCYYAGAPGIELRILGSKVRGNDVNIMLIKQSSENIADQLVRLNLESMEGTTRFVSGQTFNLPGTKNKYRLKVMSVEPDNAKFTVEKVLQP